MKKFISLISVLLFSALLLSCSGTKKEITDEDFDVLPDTNDSIYDDDSAETVDDSGEPDEDFNDFDNESDNLSFKTRPHGITKWDETYSYFIRCESVKELKTVITVSKDDTCKGTIKSNTYTFTPTKTKFPEGRCLIAVECSNGENKITQKTQILIPNPVTLLPEFNDSYYIFYFMDSYNGKDFFTLRTPPTEAFLTDPETRIYETGGTPENTKLLAVINEFNAQVLSINGDIAIITDGYYVNSYNIKTKEKKQLAYSEGSEVTEQTGPMQMTTFYYPGVIDYHVRIGDLTLFGIHLNTDYYYFFHLFTTDGTPEGTVGHDLYFGESFNNISLDQKTEILKESSGGFYINRGIYYYYIDEKGIETLETEASIYSSLGFTNDMFFYLDRNKNPNKLIALKNGKEFQRYTAKNYGYIQSSFVSGTSINVMETSGMMTKILHFPDGDLLKEPVSAELFESNFSNMQTVVTNGPSAIVSGYNDDTEWHFLKQIHVNSEEKITISEPFHYYKEGVFFYGHTLAGQMLLFEEKGILYSVPVDGSREPQFLLTGNSDYSTEEPAFYFYGNLFSDEAAFEYFSAEKNKYFIVVTDGINENTKELETIPGSNLELWEKGLLENGSRFIVEESEKLERVEICSGECSSTDRYKTDKSIYLIDKTNRDSHKFFVYHLPETE